MKTILPRLFNHEELTAEESKQILLNISREMYSEAQIAALLTVFQMRSITVDELAGFREALMETRIPIDFAPYRPIDIVGTGGGREEHLQHLHLRQFRCGRGRL